MADAVVFAPDPEENTGYRFSWGLALAGGVTATAVTFFLLTLGSGFGLMLIDPLNDDGPSAPTMFNLGAAYFFAAQAFGFAAGGYLAGRLLGPLIESQRQEDSRAAAHGLVAWAVTILATLTMAAIVGMTTLSTGGMMAALYGAKEKDASSQNGAPTAYLVDVLFRPSTATFAPQPSAAPSSMPDDPVNLDAIEVQPLPPVRNNPMASAAAREEAGRLIETGMLVEEDALSMSDRTRLAAIIAQETGVPREEATNRIEQLRNQVQAETRQAADTAREIASYTAIWIAASLLFGAIVSMFAAVSARTEDDREAMDEVVVERRV